MSQLMLINPSKRPSKRKKPRTAAQKAATKRMLAARAGKSKPATSRKRRSASRAMSAITRRVKSRRKNPIGGGIASMLMPAAKGALGAVAVNTLESQVVSRFLPVTLQGDMGQAAVRVGLAVALGTMGGKVIGNANARQAAEGALVVTLHDVFVKTVNRMLPVGAGLSAYAPDELTDSGMGAYAPLEGIGESSPYAYES